MSLLTKAFPHLTHFHLDTIDSDDDTLCIAGTAKTRTSCCPACSYRSRSVHSWYTRTVSDLPVSGRRVILADAVQGAQDRTGARRLVIDSIGEMERAVAEGGSAERVPGYLAALIEALRARRVTMLAIRESAQLVAPALSVATDPLVALVENVLLLQHVAFRDRLHRVLSAPKMRFSAHDLQVREFGISSPEGIRVLAPRESAAGVLSGIAVQQGRQSAVGTAEGRDEEA